jgi:DNA-binding CsgD family transcriptional regulator
MKSRPQRTYPDAPVLLEREGELARVATAVADARAGGGELLVVEGPAGIGKTRLLGAAATSARASGVAVLCARGAELERDLAFGIVRQLLEPALARVGAPEQPALLRGGAWRAAAALELIPRAGETNTDRRREPTPGRTGREDAGVIVHGLYWVIATLAEREPLLLCIDDAHWSDPPSARLVAYLARRLEDLPVLVILALREGEQGLVSSGIAEVIASAGAGVITLQPLSRAACAELVRCRLSEDAEPSFCEACHVATGGNPFLLAELTAQLSRNEVAPTAANAARVGALRPESVARAVLATITRLGHDAAELARSLAVLGTAASPRWARELAGLDVASAAAATDALVAAQVFGFGRPLEFAHPLTRAVVYDSIPPAQRALAHARAARILRRDGAEADRVAAQLLLSEPAVDDGALAALCEAAEGALQRGAPEVAATYLSRALEEPLSSDARAGILFELGRARVRAGDPRGLEDLFGARAATDDVRSRAEIALELGRGLMLVDRSREALDLLCGGRADLGNSDPALSSLLRAEEVGAALLDVSTAKRATAALARWDPDRVGDSLGERLLLAYGSYFAAARGAPAADAAALAKRAVLSGDLISEQTVTALCFSAFVLCVSDRIDDALRVLDRAILRAREQGSKLIFVLATWMRSHAHYRRGELDDAETDASTALEAGVDDWFTAPVAFFTDVLLERGELDAAEAMFTKYGLTDVLFPNLLVANFLLDARGRLRCAQRRWREGLDDLLAVGERLQAWEATNPASIAWRSSAALAHAALGEHDHARRLSDEEVTLARSFGAPRALGVALRAAGLLHEPPTSIELLSEAATVLESSPARLELARALTDLGAALRRGGHRADARKPLRRGLDLASRCGATVLAARAREELVTAGARPRRERMSGTRALTASERRVATLAATGLSNREIAQALFITIRTVKAHLGHAFEKLDITNRAQLADALATDGAESDIAVAPRT